MKIATIILAAGLSRRMGVLKPLLPVGGTTAVLRTVHIAKSAGAGDVFLVTGYRHEDIRQAVINNAPDVQYIYNSEYNDGMFSSVLAGVSALPPETDALLLLPADCCAVSPDTLTALLRAFSESDGKTVIYPTFSGRHGHPPLIPARAFKALLDYTGERGLAGYLRTCRTRDLDVPDPGIMLDMDTPKDYAALLEHIGLPSYPDREACRALLRRYCVPEDIVAHGEQVAALALHIADLIEQSGGGINRDLLESACLLHDIARHEPNHAQAGARLLIREGHPRAAILVAAHMDAPEDARAAAAVDESAILFLADKLCRRGQIIPLENTLEAMRRKFAGDPAAMSAATGRVEYAIKIMERICARFGIEAADIAGFSPGS